MDCNVAVPFLAATRVRFLEPVPVARPTLELGVGVPTVAVVGVLIGAPLEDVHFPAGRE